MLLVGAVASAAMARTASATTLAPRIAAPITSTHTTLRGVGVHVIPRELEPLVLEAIRDSLVSLALSQLGMPYVLGGATPRRGFDCSGLVRWATSQLHLYVPRTAGKQALVGEPVPRDALRPGDLIAFGDGKRVSHVGIYVGAGKFVHASSVAGRVVVSALNRPPSRLIRPMRGARRILAIADQLGS